MLTDGASAVRLLDMKTNNAANEMATIQHSMGDAHHAMRLAVEDNRWLDVAKYAGRLAKLQEQHARATEGGRFIISASGLTARHEV